MKRPDLIDRWRLATSLLHKSHNVISEAGLGVDAITDIARLAWEPHDRVIDALITNDEAAFELHLGALEIAVEAYARAVVMVFGSGEPNQAVLH